MNCYPSTYCLLHPSSKYSLVATIRESRPELLTNEPKGTMIPLDIPIELAEQLEKSALPHIEGIGEPATACFFTGAKTSPIGWYVFLLYPPSLTIRSKLFCLKKVAL